MTRSSPRLRRSVHTKTIGSARYYESLFARARREVGMAPADVAANAGPFVEDVSPVGDEWRHFYGQWFGKVDYHCPGELSYTRIWKDANNAIRYNLQKLEECCASREPDPDAMVCFFEGNPTDGCVPCGEGAPRPVANASRVRAVAFTFVREPIGHFVAGYAEVNWRAATNAGVA